jgi:hypothetical protein
MIFCFKIEKIIATILSEMSWWASYILVFGLSSKLSFVKIEKKIFPNKTWFENLDGYWWGETII